MLKGRRALVTGSTRGIGLGIAKSLAGQGCDLMLNGFGEPAEIEKLRTELEKTHGVRVFHHGADLSKPAEIADLVRSAAARLGGLELLRTIRRVRRDARQHAPARPPGHAGHGLARPGG